LIYLDYGNQCFGSGAGLDTVQLDPDPGRPKLSRKPEKIKNLMFEVLFVGLEPERPLEGFKETSG
jgi:hypothetical protein